MARQIEKGDSPLKAMVEESIGERGSKKSVEGLNKLTLYKSFGKEVRDAGTRLIRDPWVK